MANLEVKFPVSRDSIAALYLSQLTGIDPCTALYLHDKYKEDFFFFFYMFCGKKVTFPGVDAMVKARKSSNVLYKNLTTTNYTNPELIRDKDALAYMESHLSDDRKDIVMTITPEGEIENFPYVFGYEENTDEEPEVVAEGQAL